MSEGMGLDDLRKVAEDAIAERDDPRYANYGESVHRLAEQVERLPIDPRRQRLQEIANEADALHHAIAAIQTQLQHLRDEREALKTEIETQFSR